MDQLFKNMIKFPNQKKVSADYVENLYLVPKKDKGDEMPKFGYPEKNWSHQADLLFLPNDGGYRYALVIADIGTRLCDAEPLKTKDSDAIIAAFKAIYGRKILKMPENITVDSGSEFKGYVKQYLEKNGVAVKTAKVGRHRQVAIVEKRNQFIGTLIHKIQKMVEVDTGNVTSEWINILPEIIKTINKHYEIKNVPKEDILNPPPPIGNLDNLLKEGTRVRVMLEEPHDISGVKLHGKFRSGDIRWDPKERIVKQVSIKPGSPVLYILDGTFGKNKLEPIGYTRNQIQVIPDNEVKKYPTLTKMFSDNSDMMEVEKLLNHKTENRIKYFLVKWRTLPKINATWEKRTELIKTIPNLVLKYEASLK